MAKNTAKNTAKPGTNSWWRIQMGLLLEDNQRKFQLLQEGHAAARTSFERKFDERMDRFEATLNDLVTGQAALVQGHTALVQGQAKLEQGQAKLEQGQAKLEQGQAALGSRVAALEAGQLRIEAQLTDVVSSVKRHDAEIIKLWADRRSPPRSSRPTRG